MLATAVKVKQLDYYTCLNRDFRSDLHWWNTFLVSWNGLSLLRSAPAAPQFHIHCDASGNWGCRAVFCNQWFQLAWDKSWLGANIMAKELVPIILSTAVWGPLLQRSQVCYHCDNSSVVTALSKGSAHDAIVMQLLRCLWFFIAHHDIHIVCEHIVGSKNIAADHLSFFSSCPQASSIPTPLPPALLMIVAIPCPDWTSELCTKLFNSIISTA